MFDGHRQNADDPGRGRASEAWAEVYPDDSAALTWFCEALAQLIPAALGRVDLRQPAAARTRTARKRAVAAGIEDDDVDGFLAVSILSSI